MNIIRALYTFSWDGFCVEMEDGHKQTCSPKQLLGMVGKQGYDEICWATSKLPGHWHRLEKPVKIL